MPSDARSQAFSCRRRASWFCVFSISVSKSRMDRSRYGVESPLSRKPEGGVRGFMNPGDPALAVCGPDRPVRPKSDPSLEDCSKGRIRKEGLNPLLLWGATDSLQVLQLAGAVPRRRVPESGISRFATSQAFDSDRARGSFYPPHEGAAYWKRGEKPFAGRRPPFGTPA